MTIGKLRILVVALLLLEATFGPLFCRWYQQITNLEPSMIIVLGVICFTINCMLLLFTIIEPKAVIKHFNLKENDK